MEDEAPLVDPRVFLATEEHKWRKIGIYELILCGINLLICIIFIFLISFHASRTDVNVALYGAVTFYPLFSEIYTKGAWIRVGNLQNGALIIMAYFVLAAYLGYRGRKHRNFALTISNQIEHPEAQPLNIVDHGGIHPFLLSLKSDGYQSGHEWTIILTGIILGCWTLLAASNMAFRYVEVLSPLFFSVMMPLFVYCLVDQVNKTVEWVFQAAMIHNSFIGVLMLLLYISPWIIIITNFSSLTLQGFRLLTGDPSLSALVIGGFIIMFIFFFLFLADLFLHISWFIIEASLLSLLFFTNLYFSILYLTH